MLSFHIRHEVRPERVKEVFVLIANDQPFNHVIQAERQLTYLRQIRLIENSELSAVGNFVHTLCVAKADLWGDLVHFIQYTLWQEGRPEENGFSWTYRNLSDHLWRLGVAQKINYSFFEPIVSALINQAETSSYFEVEQTRKAAVSLSRDSLRAGYHWLGELVPPVIENDTFTRRYFCPPELTLLAIGWVAQQTEGELGIDFLLTPERREMLCKLCLLDPAALDRVLDRTLPLYPNVLVPGTSAGVYGRFIRFLKWPEMSDLLR
ncbi:MAG: hypothetical protein Fur0021_18490 [Candidatus Promineifilaceae bacterium]